MTELAKLQRLQQSPAVSSTAEADLELAVAEFGSVSRLIEEVRCLRARNEQLRLGLREVQEVLAAPLQRSW